MPNMDTLTEILKEVPMTPNDRTRVNKELAMLSQPPKTAAQIKADAAAATE